MWAEKLPNGKYKFVERFIDPVTGDAKRVSVVMEKNTKLAYEILRSKMYTSDPTTITLGELFDIYLEAQKPLVKASTWERNKVSLGTIKSILGGRKADRRLDKAKVSCYWKEQRDYQRIFYKV